jgi:hypothetical protein
MPSFDAARYTQMTHQLHQAVQAQDWPRLGQLDALIQRWIEAAASTPVSDAEQAAWRQVAQAHAKALQACVVARQAASAQLQSLQNSQEAQKAYAWQEVLG